MSDYAYKQRWGDPACQKGYRMSVFALRGHPRVFLEVGADMAIISVPLSPEDAETMGRALLDAAEALRGEPEAVPSS